MESPVEKNIKTVVDHSGNSDVDVSVHVEIETKAIAYGMLCSLYAKGDLTEQQLEKAIQKLDNLIDRDKSKNREKRTAESRPRLYEYPPSAGTWSWI